PICLVSGLRATNGCPSTVEWFLPGTEPTRDDDWYRDGRVVLPPEYTEWLAMGEAEGGFAGVDDGSPDAIAVAPRRPGHEGGAAREAGASNGGVRRILSPADGDVYERPVGVDPRYATIPLLAAGEEPVRWFVDGVPHHGARWRLVPGVHVIRAEWASGVRDSVRIEVR
ncbi:MAG TPA: hypothetical protein VIL18_09635, partial [Longimicrobiales bacterium]